MIDGANSIQFPHEVPANVRMLVDTHRPIKLDVCRPVAYVVNRAADRRLGGCAHGDIHLSLGWVGGKGFRCRHK